MKWLFLLGLFVQEMVFACPLNQSSIALGFSCPNEIKESYQSCHLEEIPVPGTRSNDYCVAYQMVDEATRPMSRKVIPPELLDPCASSRLPQQQPTKIGDLVVDVIPISPYIRGIFSADYKICIKAKSNKRSNAQDIICSPGWTHQLAPQNYNRGRLRGTHFVDSHRAEYMILASEMLTQLHVQKVCQSLTADRILEKEVLTL